MQKGNLISAYLIHSFLYYICNFSVISDAEYDAICLELLDKIDSMEHPHKELISKEALKAGTGYHIRQMDYPLIVRNIALHLREDPLYLDNLAKKELKTATRIKPKVNKALRTLDKQLTLLDF